MLVGDRHDDPAQLPICAKANRLYTRRKDHLRRNRSDKSMGSDEQRSPVSDVAEPGEFVRTQKKVRFRLNPDGSVLAEAAPHGESSSASMLLTEEDIKNLWYTDQECSDIELRADERTNFFLATNGRYHAALEQLLTSCLERTNNNLAWRVFRAPREEETQQTMFTSNEALRLVVDPEVRGLEFQTVGALSSTLESCRLYRSYRDIHVSRVLDCRGIWRNDSSLTTSQKATLLAQRARQYSGVSVIFARILADGDAEAAIEDNGLSQTENTQKAKDMEETCCSPSPTTVIDVSIGFDSDTLISSEILEKISFPFDYMRVENEDK